MLIIIINIHVISIVRFEPRSWWCMTFFQVLEMSVNITSNIPIFTGLYLIFLIDFFPPLISFQTAQLSLFCVSQSFSQMAS